MDGRTQRPTVLFKTAEQQPTTGKKTVTRRTAAKVEILKQGFLMKQGGARGGRKNWKRRFFVIKEDCLYYYTDPEQTTLLGVMPLQQSKILDMTTNVAAPPAFIESKVCFDCKTKFTITNRVHHCRSCGHPYCDKCCSNSTAVPKYGFNNPVRTCNSCFKTLTEELELGGMRSGRSNTADERPDDDYDSAKFTLPGVKKDNLFALKSSERELWVHADSRQESLDWIGAIKQVMDRNQESSVSGTLLKEERKDDWEINYSQIKMGDLVGSGAFGDVYKATLWGTDIAVKTLRTEQFDSKEKLIVELKKEVDILAQLRHPNVILYMGVSGLPNVCILTEWCARGSLYDILHDHSVHINAKLMIDIGMGIAQGMNYLHSLERKIIHRDLKSHNILISENWQVKVADFGLSHIREQSKQKTQPTAEQPDRHYGVFGTPEWMAPEVMEGQAYNEKVDVYSFGILLTELVSRQMPFHDKYEIRSYMDVWDAVLDDGAIPTIPKWCDNFLQELIVSCLDRDPSNRPSFAQIIPMLRQYIGLTDNEYLIKYDLPRIGEMILSPEPTVQALAVSEIAELLATKQVIRAEPPPPKAFEEEEFLDAGRRVRSGAASNPLYLEKKKSVEPYYLLDTEAQQIFQRCTILLTSSSSQVQLSACRALANLLELSDKPKRIMDRDALLADGGVIRPLVELLSSPTEVIVHEASRVLIHLTRDLSPEAQLIFKGLPSESLDLFKEIVKKDLEGLRVQYTDLDRLIQHQGVFIQALADYSAAEAATARLTKAEPLRKNTSGIKAPRRKPAKKSFHFEDPKETEEERELKTALEARSRLDDDWLSLLQTKTPMPEKFRLHYANAEVHGHLLIYQPAEHEWKIAYLILYGKELKIFEGVDDDPEDPRHIIHLEDVYGGHPDIPTGIMHDQPFCFSIVDLEEKWCFSAGNAESLEEWRSRLVSSYEKNIASMGQSQMDYCRRCKISPAHPGMTCQEFALKRKEEKKTKVDLEAMPLDIPPPPPDEPPATTKLAARVWAPPFAAHWGKVDYLGYLNKKKKTFNRWTQAFFVLVGTELHYYPSHRADPAAPHNTLYICSKHGKCFGKGVSISSKRDFCISVEDPNRTWLLAAESEEEMQGWLEAINNNIKTLQLAHVANPDEPSVLPSP